MEAAVEPDACRPAPASATDRLAADWGRLRPLLADDVAARARERRDRLTRDLARRGEDESRRVEGVFAQLERTLRGALAAPAWSQLSFDDLLDRERDQAERDRSAWQARLDGLDAERDRETAQVAARYAGLRELVFPFAVVLVVPDAEGPA